VAANPVIDVDQPNTWPDETRRWAEQRAAHRHWFVLDLRNVSFGTPL
jgi:hypothetical protein